MKFPQLNGWQRLWVVIAALTLVWALLHALSNAAKRGSADYDVIAAFKNPDCEHIRTLPKGFELDNEPEYGSACYDLYVENRYATNPVRSAAEYQAKESRDYKQGLVMWLGFSLALWAGGIALLYGTGATAAWVRRGFRGGSSGVP